MFDIIPGILEKDSQKAIEKLEIVKDFAKIVQIDILDGKFAESITFPDLSFLKDYSSTLFLEAHIMVQDPVDYIPRLAEIGFKRFIGQVEKMESQNEFIKLGKKYGEVGLALDLETEIERIAVMDQLDYVLLMSVKAGFSGQSFNFKVLEKIKKIKAINPDIKIEVDGGINIQTIKNVKDAGADSVVVTSALFKDNPEEEYRKLRLAIN
ncbi:thiamine phosphate synthase [Patescibacteria group bacterium]|nr:thiamine phosphate synthase [Patescibacteria group bacterium]